jgi:hypothetical protein
MVIASNFACEELPQMDRSYRFGDLARPSETAAATAAKAPSSTMTSPPDEHNHSCFGRGFEDPR